MQLSDHLKPWIRITLCILPLLLLLLLLLLLQLLLLLLFVVGSASQGLEKSSTSNEETFIRAPCCGRSCIKSDVRPFKKCGCLVCRQCLRTAAMQSRVHISNYVGSDPATGAPIWRVRCPTCGVPATLTATQLRTASIKRSAP